MNIRYDQKFSTDKIASVGRELVGVAARLHPVGDPLKYSDRDEHRDHEGLEAIARGIVGAPVTAGHPAVMIRESKSAPSIGSVTSARVEKDRVHVTIAITDDAALTRMRSSKTRPELSVGYYSSARRDAAGRLWQDQITVDHLAVLIDGARARCGSTCALKLDGSRNDCACTVTDAMPERDPEIDRLYKIGRSIAVRGSTVKLTDDDRAEMLKICERFDSEPIPQTTAVERHAAFVSAMYCGAVERFDRKLIAARDRARRDEAIALAEAIASRDRARRDEIEHGEDRLRRARALMLGTVQELDFFEAELAANRTKKETK